MLTKKTFQEKIVDAQKVFTATIEKLKTVKAEIADKIATNNSSITQLQTENEELEELSSNATKQIDQISQFIN
ncbi:MAG: hypothetical protein SNH27_14080 [Rikenellaceae bacterium]